MKIAICLLLAVCLQACGSGARTPASARRVADDCVEVLYFHGKQRCKTCTAIEKVARETIAEAFANEADEGKVVFRVIDTSAPEGEALADQYGVTWASLFVNRWERGEERRHDLTAEAFAKVPSDREAFRKRLTETIAKELE